MWNLFRYLPKSFLLITMKFMRSSKMDKSSTQKFHKLRDHTFMRWMDKEKKYALRSKKKHFLSMEKYTQSIVLHLHSIMSSSYSQYLHHQCTTSCLFLIWSLTSWIITNSQSKCGYKSFNQRRSSTIEPLKEVLESLVALRTGSYSNFQEVIYKQFILKWSPSSMCENACKRKSFEKPSKQFVLTN